MPAPPTQKAEIDFSGLQQKELETGCLVLTALLPHLQSYRFGFDMTEEQEGFCHPPPTTPERVERLTVIPKILSGLFGNTEVSPHLQGREYPGDRKDR